MQEEIEPKKIPVPKTGSLSITPVDDGWVKFSFAFMNEQGISTTIETHLHPRDWGMITRFIDRKQAEFRQVKHMVVVGQGKTHG